MTPLVYFKNDQLNVNILKNDQTTRFNNKNMLL
jgi:hypothetical protein